MAVESEKSGSSSDNLAQVHYDNSKPEYIVQDGVAYVGEKGENGGVTYQNAADGVPVESTNLLRYTTGFWGSVFLSLSRVVGTGIFSTPANILKGTGSVGLALFFWVIGYVISMSGLSVYLELASYFPGRSGADVVYLEQAYPRPRFFWPLAFGFYTCVFAFGAGNSFVLASWVFRFASREPTDWEIKGIAIAANTLVALLIIANTRLSLTLVNVFGVLKVATLLFIGITGWAVLGGAFPEKVPDPHANFRNAFEGTGNDAYSLSSSLVNIVYSYWGYANAFNLNNEIKNPVRTLKLSSAITMFLIATLYMLVNVAFFAVLSKAEILASTQITATLFWERLWGAKVAKGLTIFPVLSAFSNMLASMIGFSRQVREIGRQGLLPYPKIWVSTKPFGTPIAPVLILWFTAVLFTVAPPAGDAFQFITALQNYPQSLFLLLMTIGLLIIRHRRKKMGIPASDFKVWTPVVIFFICVELFLLIMPWVPPAGGINDSAFNFFYAASSLGGLGIILICYLYYVLWMYVLPKAGKYQIRRRVLFNDDGSVGNQLIKVPNDEVEAWDIKHDPSGRSLNENERDA